MTRSAGAQGSRKAVDWQLEPLRRTLFQFTLVFVVSYVILFLGMSRRPNMFDERDVSLTGAMQVHGRPADSPGLLFHLRAGAVLHARRAVQDIRTVPPGCAPLRSSAQSTPGPRRLCDHIPLLPAIRSCCYICRHRGVAHRDLLPGGYGRGPGLFAESHCVGLDPPRSFERRVSNVLLSCRRRGGGVGGIVSLRHRRRPAGNAGVHDRKRDLPFRVSRRKHVPSPLCGAHACLASLS